MTTTITSGPARVHVESVSSALSVSSSPNLSSRYVLSVLWMTFAARFASKVSKLPYNAVLGKLNRMTDLHSSSFSTAIEIKGLRPARLAACAAVPTPANKSTRTIGSCPNFTSKAEIGDPRGSCCRAVKSPNPSKES